MNKTEQKIEQIEKVIALYKQVSKEYPNLELSINWTYPFLHIKEIEIDMQITATSDGEYAKICPWTPIDDDTTEVLNYIKTQLEKELKRREENYIYLKKQLQK